MVTLDSLTTEMLNHACGNLSDTPGSAGNGQTEIERYGDGWQEYRIETHCVAFIIKARHESGGWVVKDYRMEDC